MHDHFTIKHLGIYKTLAKHVIEKKKKQDQAVEPEDEDGPLHQGHDVLYLSLI